MLRSVLESDRRSLGGAAFCCCKCISSAAERLRSGLEASNSQVVKAPEDYLHEAISPSAAETLSRQGYAIVDGVFDTQMCIKLKEEVKARPQVPHMAGQKKVRRKKVFASYECCT